MTRGDDQETCAGCWLFVAERRDGVPTGCGWCGVDGEAVRADNPMCSSAAAGHPATPCGEIGGDDGTTPAD